MSNNFIHLILYKRSQGFWLNRLISARLWLGIVTKAGFFCFRFPLNPLRFTSDQTNWDKCLLFNFAKLQFFNDKIDQNTHFAKLPSAKCIFYCNFEIEVLSYTVDSGINKGLLLLIFEKCWRRKKTKNDRNA